ncbi:NAD(P)/FAD-dependent oxidoreductase [Actinokineospora enzanensis]|uniref:NAD(P)/FAD-dependent oxidoreductase n=1 Tax=Actinokineospora enzanensis TaxID=155975 RepID=UPI00035EAAD9|nr:FAD-dependent oxidoreductase [Actinokineospora enzanensis]
MREIVILGAGYAGLTAAVSLAGRTKRRDDVRITLVNATERFTERLRLHQAATGQDLADLRVPELLAGTGVEFVAGWVTAVDAAARTVRVDDDRMLTYDTLVFALGGVTDTTVPGVDEHAYTFGGLQDAEALARRLGAGGTVAVCGTGLTGVEAAAEIAERYPDLDVLLLGRDEPGATLAPRARDHVQAVLDRLGVRVRAGVEIVKVAADSLLLADGSTVPVDVVLWTSGVRVSPLAAAAGFDVDERGRIITDPALRSVSHPDVYAVGDAAAVQQAFGLLHGTCQGGMPTGVHAAVSIERQLRGKEPKPFRFGYLHVPVSLGRGDAVVQFTHPDDTPKRLCLTGRRAVWYKETVSSAPWPSFCRMLTFPASGSLAWRRGGRYTR